MADPAIRFDDGAAYEQMMGVWSRLAGEVFLDWLAQPKALRWIDVGCGGGAFSELLAQRCAPAAIVGVDPSEGQLAFARARLGGSLAEFHSGDAMALPFPAESFDAAVMALVLVFVPEPLKGVAEMRRVVKPGGTVAAYMWDMTSDGFPLEPLVAAMRSLGRPHPRPPQLEASRVDMMRDLWRNAGLEAVETREIKVERRFAGFDDWWMTALKSPSLGPAIAQMTPEDVATLKRHVRETLGADGDGPLTGSARANAIKGRRPA